MPLLPIFLFFFFSCICFQALSKELWRAGFLDCPMECTFDMPWQDCQCECDAGKIGTRSPAEVLNESGVLEAVSFFDSEEVLIESFVDEDVSFFFSSLFFYHACRSFVTFRLC